jgi:hypothetical protein
MNLIFDAIFLNLIQLISSDCGIPGVPAFARIINFNLKMITYPEGYQIKYDCIDPHGLNLNGDEKRVCTDKVWTPSQIPICGN